MRPNPLHDAGQFLTQSGWFTPMFWLLLLASAAFAVLAWRADPAQRTPRAIALWLLRVLTGCMWWQQTLWKIPPNFAGLRYWNISADTTLDALAKLKPAFSAQGTVTAGNASQTSDGAAAAVLMEVDRARELGVRPIGRLVAYAVTGCLPEEMGIGPITAIPKALRRAGLKLEEIGLIEFNEAFASQMLAVMRTLGLDPARVNVNGGAIALGHPLGCTGAKLTATLLNEMRRRQVRYGMVTMCVGGGMGAAGIFERF